MEETSKNESGDIAKLTWQDSDGKEVEIFLYTAGTTLIGREVDNHIVLTNPMVSKHHAEIQWIDDGFVISDLGSSNGTYVNRNIIREPTGLTDGDRIDIGDMVLRFKSQGSFVTLPVENQGESIGEVIPDPNSIETAETAELVAESLQYHSDSGGNVKNSESPYKTVRLEVDDEPLDAADNLPTVFSDESEGIQNDLTTNFAALIKNLEIAQSQCQELQTRDLKIQEVITNVIDQLQDCLQQMLELQTPSTEAEFTTLLERLSKNPSDVNLLMALANHSTYLFDLYNDYLTLRDKIKKVNDELRASLG